MDGNSFLAEYTRQSASAVFKYNTDGILISVTFEPGESTQEVIDFFWNNLPFNESMIQKYSTIKNVKVQQVFKNLDFPTFWNAFQNKVGNKKRSEKLWDALSDTEKAKAIAYIKVYDSWLAQHRGMSKLYPETYLQQQRWNN